MPLAIDATTGDDGGADSPIVDAHHEYLLLELLGGSHDSDATANSSSNGSLYHHHHNATDVPLFGDDLDLDLELGLDDLLCDDDDNDNDANTHSAVTTTATGVSELCSTELFAPTDPLCHTTDAAATSNDTCRSESVIRTSQLPLSETRAAALSSNSSSHDAGALITKAVAAAMTRRRRPRTTATPKKHRAIGSRTGTSITTGPAIASVSTVNTAVANAPAATTAKKLLKYNSNKARDERREELLYLRRKATELTTRLTELQITQPQQLQSSPSSAIVGVWQEIASRQHESRMQSERENIRLKLVLEHQLKIAKSLEKLLKKTAVAKELARSTERVQFLRPPPVDQSDTALFAQLLRDVATSYAEVDAVFHAVGLSNTAPSRIDARVQRQVPTGRSSNQHHHRIELQVFGSKVLPFELRATASAVWHHYVFAKQRTPNRLYCHTPLDGYSSTGDTVMESFNMEVAVDSTTVRFCMKLVLRRFVEVDRVVLVWRAFFDPTHVANEPLTGVRFLERGYVVVRELDAICNTSEQHNLLQTCFISTPVSIGDLVHAEPAKVGALTDLVLSSTAANIASSHQMIENELLEQALQHKSQ